MKTKTYRIILDEHFYKIQVKFFLFWRTIQRPEDLNNKDFGGDMCFNSFEQADEYLSHLIYPHSYRVEIIKEIKVCKV